MLSLFRPALRRAPTAGSPGVRRPRTVGTRTRSEGRHAGDAVPTSGGGRPVRRAGGQAARSAGGRRRRPTCPRPGGTYSWSSVPTSVPGDGAVEDRVTRRLLADTLAREG